MSHLDKQDAHSNPDGHEVSHRPYARLILSLFLSYAAMYMIMYSMADRWTNVYFNLSNVYMTGLMAGSMLPIMLATMPGMFPSRKINLVVWSASAAGLVLFWLLLRTEAGVGDQQFMRAMIPHHAAAIQMCHESSLSDLRVRKLCEGIVASQEREISEMKSLLAEQQ